MELCVNFVVTLMVSWIIYARFAEKARNNMKIFFETNRIVHDRSVYLEVNDKVVIDILFAFFARWKCWSFGKTYRLNGSTWGYNPYVSYCFGPFEWRVYQ